MKKIRVAIIGQGRSGRDIHGACLINAKRKYHIAAVSDSLKDRCDRAVREFGCEAYTDYRQLFKRKDLDLIINTSPSNSHVPISIEILNAGFNCVCEKPLAQRVKDVDRIVAAAKKNKKILTIFQDLRFAPYFQQIEKVVNSGVLGKIVQINVAFSGFSRRYDWQSLQKCMGGNLLNTGPHLLDQALHLFGTDIMPEVFCCMERSITVGDAEDHVLLILRGKGKPLIRLEISSCKVYPGNLYEIYGTTGGLQGDETNLEWKYFNPKKFPPPKLSLEPLCNIDGLPAYPKDSIKWLKRGWKPSKAQADLVYVATKRFYKTLWNTMVEGRPLEITPQQVRRQIRVIEECQKQNPQIYKKLDSHKFH